MKKRKILFLIITFLIFSSVGCGHEKKQEKDALVQDETAAFVEASTEDCIVSESEAGGLEQREDVSREGIVQVQTETQRGSGVLWEKQEGFWYFVTASHVVEKQEQVEVFFAEYDKLCIADVHCIEGLDLSFLQVDTTSMSEEMKESYIECEVVSDTVKSGDSIWAIGYSASTEKQEYQGAIWEPWIYTEDFGNYMLLCQCEAQPGMSGGAVFTEDRAMAGIVCGQNDDGMLAVLPSAVIEGEYQLFINY